MPIYELDRVVVVAYLAATGVGHNLFVPHKSKSPEGTQNFSFSIFNINLQIF